MGASVCINYISKSVVSTTIPRMQPEPLRAKKVETQSKTGSSFGEPQLKRYFCTMVRPSRVQTMVPMPSSEFTSTADWSNNTFVYTLTYFDNATNACHRKSIR